MPPPSNPSAYCPGDAIGPYAIERCLGHGGTGVVFAATDVETGRPVAIKVLRKGLHIGTSWAYRLLREGLLLSRIDHPNICRIFDVGRSNGQPFVVMQRIDGRTLSALIDDGPLGAGVVLDIAIQLADALQEAQRHGLIHRDLKSANVMVTETGCVKVLDFGLAGTIAECRPDANPGIRITWPGSIAGTTAYMSPEQAIGGVVDHRSDLYSLGVILYELLTGALPFRGCSHRELVRAILNERHEPVTARRPDLPEALAAVVDRLLDKSRDGRFDSAAELSRTLIAIRAGTRPRPLRAALRSHTAQRLLGSLAGLVFTVCGLYPAALLAGFEAEAKLLAHPAHPPGVWMQSPAAAGLAPELRLDARPSSVAVGDDGRLVYERISVVGESSIWTKAPGESGGRWLADGRDPALLPENGGIVFAGGRGAEGLYRIGFDGAPARRVRDGFTSWPVALPNGTLLFVDGATHTLWSQAAEAVEASPVTTHPIDSRPIVSSDGRALAFVSRGRTLICTLPACADARWLAIDTPHAWSPDGRALAYVGGPGRGNVWLAPIDGGPAVQLTHFTDREVTSVTWSRDGKRLAVARVTTIRDLIAGYLPVY
jgi:hypothetical protein